MERARSITGLIAGIFMMTSAGAHSLMGWKVLRSALEQSHVPADVIRALGMGWNFGGVAMLTFGFIVVASFRHRLRRQPVSLAPAIVIGTAYLLFGAGALAVSRFDPFFFVFVIPGALLLFASVGRNDA